MYFASVLFLVLSISATGISIQNSTTWTNDCPADCVCHLARLSSLPIYQFTDGSHDTNELDDSYLTNNEFVFDDDWRKKQNITGDELETATCVIRKGTDVELLFKVIPVHVKVLTFMQAPDTDPIQLVKRHFAPFQQLISLDIEAHHSNKVKSHGDKEENGTEEHKMSIETDVLEVMPKLQYLNLENLALEGQNAANKDDETVHELVFLKPEENEVVSYDTYKTELNVKMLHLKVLRIHRSTFDWKILSGLSQLEYLSLENNELHFVPDFAFYSNPNLKTLSLAKNHIMNLSPTGLAGLLNLKKLDISRNDLSHLSELSLPPFPSLEVADFRHNPITDIFPNTFEVMNTTKELYIGGKQEFLNIYANSFVGLSNLEKLTLNNIKVDILERDLFRGMKNLCELSIRGPIRTISYDAFLQIPKLEKLTLNRCGIKKLSMDAFVGLKALNVLDLSHNDIEELAPSTFDDLISLRELWLQHNSLATLPKSVFKNVPAKLIRLEGNPWDCTCELQELKPTVVNKVRKIGPKEKVCTDSGCTVRQQVYYNYEKRVAPLCRTPEKFSHWTIFDALRRELRCKRKGKWTPKLASAQIRNKPLPEKAEVPEVIVDVVPEQIFALPKEVPSNKDKQPLPVNKSQGNIKTAHAPREAIKPQPIPAEKPKSEPEQPAGNRMSDEKQASPIANAPNKQTVIRQTKAPRLSRKAWKLEQERRRLRKQNKLE